MTNPTGVLTDEQRAALLRFVENFKIQTADFARNELIAYVESLLGQPSASAQERAEAYAHEHATDGKSPWFAIREGWLAGYQAGVRDERKQNLPPTCSNSLDNPKSAW